MYLVQIVCSSLWDRTAPRRVIFACLTLASLSMMTFGLSGGLPAICLLLFEGVLGLALAVLTDDGDGEDL